MATILEQEIAQQPGVIRRLLETERENVQTIAAAIRDANPAFVHIAARGTSDNAARYAQYALGTHMRLPVALAAPSLHTLYNAAPKLDRAVVIGISQSGMAADVAQVLIDARAQGALTVSITNKPDSPLAQAAHHHIALHAEEEVSVAATKTYTAQLTAVAMLVAALKDTAELSDQLAGLPDAVQKTLDLSAPIATRAERYRYMSYFVSLGRGYNYCTAFEVSLKIAELCYVIGQGYSEADFLHGPIALVQNGFPAIVVAPKGATSPQMSELLQKLGERQAECMIISNDEAVLRGAQIAMPIPDMPEWLTPITAVIPGQIFAMQLAMAKGHAVDKPRGLSKVTVTK
jgi:glutamine---fructose-6-phosphate transaminase (isomerizing)